MSYSIYTLPPFDRQVKKLSKKYHSLKQDLIALGSVLAANPRTGVPLGKDCYKVRMPITSKGKGKRGSARVITHVFIRESSVYLLAIYDKSHQSDISDKEISELLAMIQ